jgi:hypothetical protein
MEYKWVINKVQVAEDNCIVKVELTVTGVDGDKSASAAFYRTFTRGDSFVPYEYLTEQQVLAWCFAPEVIICVGTDGAEQTITKHLKDEGEAQVAGQIERQLAQEKIEPVLPWAEIPA